MGAAGSRGDQFSTRMFETFSLICVDVISWGMGGVNRMPGQDGLVSDSTDKSFQDQPYLFNLNMVI
jgi:hypothetical protein